MQKLLTAISTFAAGENTKKIDKPGFVYFLDSDNNYVQQQ